MTPPAPADGDPTMPGFWPGRQPAQLTEDDLEAVADLTAMAAELTARGYRTRMETTVTPAPRLTITHLQVTACQYVSACGRYFCWESANEPGALPFGLRPPVPITATADAADVIMRYWMAIEEEGQQ